MTIAGGAVDLSGGGAVSIGGGSATSGAVGGALLDVGRGTSSGDDLQGSTIAVGCQSWG